MATDGTCTLVSDADWQLDRLEPDVGFDFEAADTDDDSDEGGDTPDAGPEPSPALDPHQVHEQESSLGAEEPEGTDAAVPAPNPEDDASAAAQIDNVVADEAVDEPGDDETVRSWLLGEAPAADGEAPAADGEAPAADDDAPEAPESALDSASEASFAISETPACVISEDTVADSTLAASVAAEEAAAEVDKPTAAADASATLPAVVEEDDDVLSEDSFRLLPGETDRFAIEPSQSMRHAEPSNRVRRVPLPSRVQPARDGAGGGIATERSHAYPNDLTRLRANLRSLGPVGEPLYALATQQVAIARRTLKHTPRSELHAVGEAEWWQCLLESLGMPNTT